MLLVIRKRLGMTNFEIPKYPMNDKRTKLEELDDSRQECASSGFGFRHSFELGSLGNSSFPIPTMTTQLIFNGLLVFATLSTLLVTGLLFTFALLVMPGLGQLDDRSFLRGFQEIDRIIQHGHPVFVVVWLGSILSLLAATVVGFGQLEGLAQGLLVAATVLYILGVQLPTVRGNVPLNNELQTLEIMTLSETELAKARQSFEPAWNRINLFRTIICLGVAILLILVVVRR